MSERVAPTKSWIDPETHMRKSLGSAWYRAVVALQDSLTYSTVQFWRERAIPCGHLPVTTGSVSSPMGLGSDSLPVSVELFGVTTYLADSMQFGLEYLCRLSESGAYYLMPSFRGEAADATHLCQFFHSEAEIPGGLDDVVALVEQYVRRLGADMLANHADIIESVAGSTAHVEQLLARPEPFTRLTFDEAADLLGDEPRYVEVHDGWRTLTRLGEGRLTERFGDFLWISHWDAKAVPFYQAVDAQGRALNADLLFGPGEVVGCGERHANGADVLDALAAHEVGASTYDWYVEMKDVQPMRTSGFGLGVERFFMWLLQQDDIRDFQLLPRENGVNIVP
ncbi:amino acid--tRNA ligase-related protein [uncultured Cellulomonas sp.]|uniref:amino acid--tRNA ligase-related protein n=1 Tax=uncultured Cellulomonas sp. TaxID=189682 RepID=UPI0028EC221D|nr:amino acid--tRNA ligase-related protein [uncultured Cellulomonas sp.]